MKFTRVYSSNGTGYWPDDLPAPSTNSVTTEIHYVQCGCTVQETPSDAPFAFYGDVVSWSPTSSTHHNHNGTSDAGTPPRSVSPAPSVDSQGSSEPEVRRVVDAGFCEKATCKRSKVFNREWNRLWQEHNSEMREALDDQAVFEAFKAKIRREAKEATEGLLGRMPGVSA